MNEYEQERNWIGGSPIIRLPDCGGSGGMGNVGGHVTRERRDIWGHLVTWKEKARRNRGTKARRHEGTKARRAEGGCRIH